MVYVVVAPGPRLGEGPWSTRELWNAKAVAGDPMFEAMNPRPTERSARMHVTTTMRTKAFAKPPAVKRLPLSPNI
jgi:hypothetical protein